MENKQEGLIALIIILIIFCFALTFSYLYIPSKNYKFDFSEIEFKENITIDDMKQISNIIESLKPKYKDRIKHLIVYKNLNEDYAGLESAGIITIEIRDNINVTKYILCHEILHTLIYKSTGEQFVYDISEYGVCYK